MAAMLLDDIFGNGRRLIRTDIGYQIGRHVGIKGVHIYSAGQPATGARMRSRASCTPRVLRAGLPSPSK
jgi:hypothetical protein